MFFFFVYIKGGREEEGRGDKGGMGEGVMEGFSNGGGETSTMVHPPLRGWDF